MKKKFNLIDLDCANCAAKMEAAIQKLAGVQSATVSFLQQKMTIEAEEGVDFDALMAQVVKVCKRAEPDCQIVLK